MQKRFLILIFSIILFIILFSCNLSVINTDKPQSDNAYLSAIEIVDGTLSPSFSTQVKQYSVIISKSTTCIKVKAILADPNASLAINSNNSGFNPIASGSMSPDINLVIGSNIIQIKVTSESGKEISLYTLSINRLSNIALLQNLTLSSGSLNPVFSDSTTSYVASVGNSVSQITVTPTAQDTNAVIKLKINNGSYTDIISGIPSGFLSLNVGNNTVDIQVTAMDGVTMVNYTIIVIRAGSSNALLTSISLSTGVLSPVFSSLTNCYNVSVGSSTGSITVTSISADVNSSLKVRINSGVYFSILSGNPSGSLALNTGNNIVEIQVTAQDNSINIYSVVVRRLSNNADLSGLTLSSGVLSPAFSSETVSYNAGSVPVLNVTLTSTVLQADAGVEVRVNGGSYFPIISGNPSGNLSLNIGSNSVDVKVTAEDGITAKVYQITITRLSNNTDLADLDLSAGVLTPVFSADTTAYNAGSVSSVSLSLIPTVSQSAAVVAVRVNGGSYSPIISGNSSGYLSLNIGSNLVEVKVTAEDGITVKVYQITVTRLSNDVNLIGLNISSGTLNPAFVSGTLTYTASVIHAITGITITPTSSQAGAMIEARINNGTFNPVSSGTASSVLNLNVGVNIIQIRVTAEDKISIKTYEIALTRAASSNALLSGLIFSGGTLGPSFSSGTNGYSAVVGSAVTTATVTPTTIDSTATVQIRINGGSYMSVTSGSPSGSISLNIGDNTIEILVTAQDLSTNSYTITVHRKSNNADLNGLSLSAGNLTPAFSAANTSYNAGNVTMSNMKVTPVSSHSLAVIKVQINGGGFSPVMSGSPSGVLSLNVGNNTIDVQVTSEDGTTVKTYSVVIRRLSSACDLSGLSLSDGSLTPSFLSAVTTYTATVGSLITSMLVTPVSSDSNSIIDVRVNGGSYKTVKSGYLSSSLGLNIGNNMVDVRVTAEDGTTIKIYSVAVHRLSDNANLSSLVLSAGTLNPIFASGTTSYNAGNIVVTSMTMTPASAYSASVIKIRVNDGTYNTVVSGSPSAALNLNIGSNTVDIQVTSEDGLNVKVYTITIKRLSNNSWLSGLTLSSGILSPPFSGGMWSYDAHVSSGISSVTITPTSSDSNAGIEVRINGGTYTAVASGSPSGSLNLNIGNNTANIRVTAEDGITIQTYTVTVYRFSSNADLLSLVLSAGTLSPVFASGTTSYNAGNVSVTSMTVTPTATYSSSNIKVRVNGGSYSYVSSGSPSDSLNLNIGTNTIDFQVTSEDTSTVKVYSITVNRLSNDAYLSMLVPSLGTLSPSFSSGTTAYTSSVGNAVSSITVTPTSSHPSAKIQVRVNGGSYTAVTSGSPSGSLVLNVGNNTVNVRVTAQDGITVRTYTIMIMRISNNANLSNLLLSSNPLSPLFNVSYTEYNGGSATVSSVTVTPTAANSYATIQVRINGGTYSNVSSGYPSGALNLIIGDNTIEVKVTAQDGTTVVVYTITIYRKSNDANLSGLILSSGTLSPAFSSGTISYTSTASYMYTFVSVTPALSNSNSIMMVRINGGSYVQVLNGHTSDNLPVLIGNNTINVQVTAEDGITVKMYTIALTIQFPTLNYFKTYDVSMSYQCKGVSLSSDGSKALVAGYGEACLFDTATGSLLKTFNVSMGYVCESVSLSPDGTKALVGGFGEARLFDTATGNLLKTFNVSMGYACKAVYLSPDGTKALVGGFGEARLFETVNGSLLKTFKVDMGYVCEAVSLNSNTTRALVGGFGEARLFDTASGFLLKTFDVDMGYVCKAVSLSADGTRSLVGGFGEALLFDTASGSLLKTFDVSMGYVCEAVILNSDNRIALVGGFRFAYLFSTDSGNLIQSMNVNMSYVVGSVALNSSGTTALISQFGEAQLFK